MNLLTLHLSALRVNMCVCLSVLPVLPLQDPGTWLSGRGGVGWAGQRKDACRRSVRWEGEPVSSASIFLNNKKVKSQMKRLEMPTAEGAAPWGTHGVRVQDGAEPVGVPGWGGRSADRCLGAEPRCSGRGRQSQPGAAVGTPALRCTLWLRRRLGGQQNWAPGRILETLPAVDRLLQVRKPRPQGPGSSPEVGAELSRAPRCRAPNCPPRPTVSSSARWLGRRSPHLSSSGLLTGPSDNSRVCQANEQRDMHGRTVSASTGCPSNSSRTWHASSWDGMKLGRCHGGGV